MIFKILIFTVFNSVISMLIYFGFQWFEKPYQPTCSDAKLTAVSTSAANGIKWDKVECKDIKQLTNSWVADIEITEGKEIRTWRINFVYNPYMITKASQQGSRVKP